MLILSRKEGEALVLKLPNGTQVKIILLRYSGMQTKVGVKAPSDVIVLREELT